MNGVIFLGLAWMVLILGFTLLAKNNKIVLSLKLHFTSLNFALYH